MAKKTGTETVEETVVTPETPSVCRCSEDARHRGHEERQAEKVARELRQSGAH